MTEADSCRPVDPGCHSRRVLAGIQCLVSFPSFVRPHGGFGKSVPTHADPIRVGKDFTEQVHDFLKFS